jgi:chromosome segregation ATPase
MNEETLQKFRSRLDDLHREQAAGEAQLRALEERREHLQQTLYRISGAIQVIVEMTAEGAAE